MLEADLDRERLDLAGEHPTGRGGDGVVLRAHEVLEVHADELLGRVAEHVGEHGVDAREDAVRAGERHARQSGVEGAAEHLLALAQLRLGPQPGADVPGVDDPPGRRALVVYQRCQGDCDVDALPALGDLLGFDVLRLTSTSHRRAECCDDVRAASRHGHLEVRPDHLVGAVAVEPLGCGVPAGEKPGEVPAVDGVVGGLHHLGQGAHALLGESALAHITQERAELPAGGGLLPAEDEVHGEVGPVPAQPEQLDRLVR